jgi:hypothetical protein
VGKYRNFGFQIPLDPHVGSGDFDENRVGVGHPTWVDPPVDVSLARVDCSTFAYFAQISGIFDPLIALL